MESGVKPELRWHFPTNYGTLAGLSPTYIHRGRHWPQSLDALIQWRIEDSPELGVPTLQGRQHTILTKISQKLHEIERFLDPGGWWGWRGGGGGGSLAAPLDPM